MEHTRKISSNTNVGFPAIKVAERQRTRTERNQWIVHIIGAIALIAATLGVATIAAHWAGSLG